MALVVFPYLRETVVMRRCDPDRQISTQRLAHNLVLVYVLRDMTKMELWLRDKSIWHEASLVVLKS